MTRPISFRAASCLWAILAMLLIGSWSAAAQARPDSKGSRRLADALRALQSGGLRIVFSSETVTPDMRVISEPRARTSRQILDELLLPHGLTAEDGPGHVILVVRAKPATAVKPRKRATAAARGEADGAPIANGGPRKPGSYNELVTVEARHPGRPGASDAFEAQVGGRELQNLGLLLTDDPLRAVQALPRVAASDDFRSEFSVRGSPYRHIGVVIDEVATPWLRHAAYGRGETGSVAMLGGDVLEQATLQAGAYPHRYGDRLGAQLGLTLRAGSRTDTRFRGSVGGATARLVAEGPLGRSQRGSWLFTVRNSYLDWPIRRARDVSGTVFGFADAQAKLVYDVRPGQQASVSVLGGQSNIDEGDNLAPADLADGTNRALIVNLAWRSMFGPHLVLNQRTYLVAHRFVNKYQTGQTADRGSNQEIAYRADLVWSTFGGVLETGGQVQRLGASRQFPAIGIAAFDALPIGPMPVGAFDGASWLRSGYAHFTRKVTPRFTVAPGVRVADATLVRRRTLAPWILGQWALGSAWSLNASTGVSHQFPEFEHVLGRAGGPDLKPERATHADVAIEHRLSPSVRWQATLFNRQESDILRGPDAYAWVVPPAGTPALLDPGAGPPAGTPALLESSAALQGISVTRYENGLVGSSRGIELLLERRSATGLSGWVAYSYGKTRHADARRHEAFWGDFDQRHAVNVFATYRLSDNTTLSATLRGGTNFPIPGYFEARGGRLFAGQRRNEVRLPGYARLDLRASRTLTCRSGRLTVFGEMLNVLNRANLGLAGGSLQVATGEAFGVTGRLFPRLASAGIVIEF